MLNRSTSLTRNKYRNVTWKTTSIPHLTRKIPSHDLPSYPKTNPLPLRCHIPNHYTQNPSIPSPLFDPIMHSFPVIYPPNPPPPKKKETLRNCSNKTWLSLDVLHNLAHHLTRLVVELLLRLAENRLEDGREAGRELLDSGVRRVVCRVISIRWGERGGQTSGDNTYRACRCTGRWARSPRSPPSAAGC